MTNIFVSYTKVDKKWAVWIAKQLEDANYECFIQAWDIKPGSNFVIAMNNAIRESERTVAVLSPDYVESDFPQPEWAVAFAKDPTGEKGTLVPVRIRDVELRDLLLTIVYIDLVGLSEDEAKRALLDGMGRNRSKPDTIPFPGDDPMSPLTKRPVYPVENIKLGALPAEWGMLDVKASNDEEYAFLFRPENSRRTDLGRLSPDTNSRRVVENFFKNLSSGTIPIEVRIALYNILVPLLVQERFKKSSRMSLVLDMELACYPWEIMCRVDDATDSAPIVLSTILIRTISDRYIETNAVTAETPNALVIGTQSTNNNLGEPISANQAEAHAVSRILTRNGLKVELISDEKTGPISILGSLYLEPFQILHIAATGVFDALVNERGELVRDKCNLLGRHDTVGSRISGLVLGDGIFLTPIEISKMRRLPSLVFINMGHSDTTCTDYDLTNNKILDMGRLAYQFSSSLISMGVHTVITSGWIVDDQTSQVFVNSFYEKLSTGSSIEDAIQAARNNAYSANSEVGVWGAFQCYGDPNYRLTNVAVKTSDEVKLLPAD